jgi:riboflavin kinase/FMN adenylyltransferase
MEVIDWGRFMEESAVSSFVAEPVALTIGVFDGLHLGHRLLIDRIVSTRSSLKAWVITFRISPDRLLHPHAYRGDLTTLSQKLEKLSALGVDRTIIIDFSEDFGKLTGALFFKAIQDRCRLSRLVVGEDFRCGYRAESDAVGVRAMLEPFFVRTDIVAHESAGDETISSTRIRTLIGEGRCAEAARLLGYAYAIDLRGLDGCLQGSSIPRQQLSQVTPHGGDYPVRLCNGSERMNDRVTIDASMIRWNIAPFAVESIVFD